MDSTIDMLNALSIGARQKTQTPSTPSRPSQPSTTLESPEIIPPE
jgi:hypothetical protein